MLNGLNPISSVSVISSLFEPGLILIYKSVLGVLTLLIMVTQRFEFRRSLFPRKFQ